MCHPTPHNLTSFDCAGTPVQPLRLGCSSKQPSTFSAAVVSYTLRCSSEQLSTLSVAVVSCALRCLSEQAFCRFSRHRPALVRQISPPVQPSRKYTSLTNPVRRFFVLRRGGSPFAGHHYRAQTLRLLSNDFPFIFSFSAGADSFSDRFGQTRLFCRLSAGAVSLSDCFWPTFPLLEFPRQVAPTLVG